MPERPPDADSALRRRAGPWDHGQVPQPRRLPPLALVVLSGAVIGCLDVPIAPVAPPQSALTAEFTACLDGDAQAFLVYARSCGAARLKEAFTEIDYSIDATSVTSYSRTMADALPRLGRIASVLGSEFSSPQYLRDVRLRAGAPPERGCAIQRELQALREMDLSPALSPDSAIRRLNLSGQRFQELGYRRGIMLVEDKLSGQCDRRGDRPGRFQHMHSAVEIAREIDDAYMICQHLGTLGDCFEDLGAPDSALACYERALGIALEHGIPDQSVRLMTFIAHARRREGRLALATEWIEQALRSSRAPGGSGHELRIVVVAMEYYAALHCWDVVERLLARCPILVRELERTSSNPAWLRYRHDVTRIEGQLRLARGDFEQANALFLASRRAQRGASPNAQIVLLHQWTQSLVEAGRMRDAEPLLEEGLEICDRWHNDRMGRNLEIRRARVLFGLGRHAEARAALEDFDRRVRERNDTPDEQRVEREVLDARLLALAGDSTGARAALRRSLEAVRHHARGLDAGPLGYLALAEMDDVRLAVHEIAGLDAAASYRFELEWRALVRELGTSTRLGLIDSTPWKLTETPSNPPPLSDGATHLVFLMSAGAIVRWTATVSGVSRDTLSMSPAECAQRVQRACESLELGAPPGASDLRRLAHVLLPESLLSAPSGGPPRLLLVSADGPLVRLPFEALDRAERGPYTPIALDFDVARLRSPAATPWAAAPGPPAILADPIAPEDVLRRLPGLGPLPAIEREAGTAWWTWDGACVFRGQEARKGPVLAALGRAPRIYIAAHLVHDPALPFSPFIPLEGDSAARTPRDEYLEIADVRALDLSGCELAVISACSSGAPYAGSGRMGPSFGDAFVDAGAGCVLQAAWPVHDARAAPLMERFLYEWRGGGDPVRALGAARRAAIRGELGACGPGDWAAWSASIAPPWPELMPGRAPAPALRASR